MKTLHESLISMHMIIINKICFCISVSMHCQHRVIPLVALKKHLTRDEKLSIVPYKRSRDCNALQNILHDFKDILMYESFGRAEGTTQEYFDSAYYQTFVIRVAHRTVGFINYVAWDAHDCIFHSGRYGHIHLLAIEKDYQQKGYATKLVSEAIKSLKKVFVCKISVAVAKGNNAAINLYKKMGFIVPPFLFYTEWPYEMPLLLTYTTHTSRN